MALRRWSSPWISSVLRSGSGYDWRLTSWSESSRETRCIMSIGWTRNSYSTSSRRIASHWRATGKPVVRIRETIWEIIRRPEVIQTMLWSRFEISRSWTIILFSSVTERRNKSMLMPRMYFASISKGNFPKQCTFWTSLGHESLQSLRKIQYWSSGLIFVSDQTESWIRILNGIDKFVREALPIQEEEKASVKPAEKATPILKPSSTSLFRLVFSWFKATLHQVFSPCFPVDSTPTNTSHTAQYSLWTEQWIDSEIQESKDPHCFQVSKFITRLLRHRRRWSSPLRPKLLMNARKSCQTIQDTGQTRWRKT